MNKAKLVALSCLALMLQSCCSASASIAAQEAKNTVVLALSVPAGSIAPIFTLNSTKGIPIQLRSLRGRPVALFFFCGCTWCHGVARIWGNFQRTGFLDRGFRGDGPRTVIVFSGYPDAATSFLHETGLDAKQTILLCDPTMSVTEDKYHASPCPRVFVVNAAGRVTYTNDHGADRARSASATAIALRAIGALRALRPKPILR